MGSILLVADIRGFGTLVSIFASIKPNNPRIGPKLFMVDYHFSVKFPSSKSTTRGNFNYPRYKMAVAFSTSSEDSVDRQLLVSPSDESVTDNWLDFLEVDRCCQWIKEGQHNKVALQFPDEYLQKSAAVARKITEDTGADTFILADTSYGSCCVDEIAAQHYNADAIIHFGHSCLSPSGRLPVLYVFGKGPVDLTDCVEKITSHLIGSDINLVLAFSVEYKHISSALKERLLGRFDMVTHLETDCERPTSEPIIPDHQSISDKTQNTTIFETFSRKFSLNPTKSLGDYSICYIGESSMFLMNLMLTFKDAAFYSYNPRTKGFQKESIAVNKLLMKRFYLVEKIKDARVVGILVATLSVSRYLDIVNRLKSLLTLAGKKYYVFSVGKINVAKLANFPEVDVYVLVSCPESVILDSTEFYSPLVTPYEVEMACDPDRDWLGDTVLDYSSILPGGSHYKPVDFSQSRQDVDVSLITGRIREMGKTNETQQSGEAGVLVTRENMHLTTVSGKLFSEKSWQGLDPQLGQTEVTKAVQGRKGIAIQYEEEPP